MNIKRYPSHHSVIPAIVVFLLFFTACSSGTKENKQAETAGKKEQNAENVIVGPIKSVQISEELDEALVESGSSIFEAKCAACHKIDERYVGPAIEGITQRREPVWIMNMIMDPQEMTAKDPVAKQLLAEYMTQMVNQNVSEGDARAILEYFRSIDNDNTNL